jgi:hypothetical protein
MFFVFIHFDFNARNNQTLRCSLSSDEKELDFREMNLFVEDFRITWRYALRRFLIAEWYMVGRLGRDIRMAALTQATGSCSLERIVNHKFEEFIRLRLAFRRERDRPQPAAEPR